MDIRATTLFSPMEVMGAFSILISKEYVFTGGLNFSCNKNIIDNESGLTAMTSG